MVRIFIPVIVLDLGLDPTPESKIDPDAGPDQYPDPDYPLRAFGRLHGLRKENACRAKSNV